MPRLTKGMVRLPTALLPGILVRRFGTVRLPLPPHYGVTVGMIARLFLVLSLAVFALLTPQGAQAQSDTIEGHWDFRIDGVTIFRFEIERIGAEEWRGSWSRPDSFATDGYAFGRLSGGVETIQSMTGISFDGKVELSFDDPRPDAIPDIFRFEQLDASRVLMTYVGTNLTPFYMVRSAPGEPMGGWNARAIYSRPRPDAGPGPEDGPVPEAASEGARPVSTPEPAPPSSPAVTLPASPAVSSYRLPGTPVVVAGSVAPAPPAPVPEKSETASQSARRSARSSEPVPEPAPEPVKRRVGADFLDGI